MALLLDAAGTLLHPSESVGTVYARHLAALTGLRIDSALLDATFRDQFVLAPLPAYARHPSGHAAEHAWWHDLVAAVLTSLGGDFAAFAQRADPAPGRAKEPVFDAYFQRLFEHYASPTAWALYPEVPAFLDAAHSLGLAPLAVVSNFDNRLLPILDGLGIAAAFDLVLTSADACARKPDPAIFRLALQRLTLSPADAIHCGDSSRADLAGARAAGIRAFHLQRPRQSLLDFLDFSRA